MGSLSLQPDMKDESTDLQLEDDLLQHLKDKYCSRVKVSSNWLQLLQITRSFLLKNCKIKLCEVTLEKINLYHSDL